MYSLTFNEELILMLIDKAAIGLVGVGVWIFVQRKLEAYKAHQALWTEISKERVKHIASEWNEMNKWDAMVGELYVHLQQRLEGGDPNSTAIDHKRATPELSETIEFLSQLKPEKLSAGLADECRQALAPEIEKSMQQSVVVSEALQANRFWMGKELYEHCRIFQSILSNICRSFGTMDFKSLARQAIKLKDIREDVLTTLNQIK
ncbi:MAG TPA: hypothetical protein VFS90_22290 [Pyrinomonadaceae bacterium]|nr:hypothetical protein [Pyrinomonadaceae bacterium]